MHLHSAHDVVQVIPCSLPQSPAVMGHREAPVKSGNFLNMCKNIAECETRQTDRLLNAYSLVDSRLSLGIGRQLSPVTFYNPVLSPMLSLTIPSRPRRSQAIPTRSPTIAELIVQLPTPSPTTPPDHFSAVQVAFLAQFRDESHHRLSIQLKKYQL